MTESVIIIHMIINLIVKITLILMGQIHENRCLFWLWAKKQRYPITFTKFDSVVIFSEKLA